MYWWLILAGCIILSVFGIVGYNKLGYKYEDGMSTIATIGILLSVILVAMCLTNSFMDAREIEEFKITKKYVEGLNTSGGYEDVGLTSHKIELNSWLMNVQASKITYGNWSFYSDEVLELTPIK